MNKVKVACFSLSVDGYGGGPETIRQYLREGLIDELHLALTPVLLGRGEPLLAELDLTSQGYECMGFKPSTGVTHVVLKQ